MMATKTIEPHLQHPQSNHAATTVHETSPLLGHVSVDSRTEEGHGRIWFGVYRRRIVAIILLLLVAFAILYSNNNFGQQPAPAPAPAPGEIVSIEHANEYLIEVDDGIQVWFRTWGRRDGVPVLFVHGGPGQAVVDYHDGNKRFFDASDCFVVEVDQRGTGNSQPSVRDSWHNMKVYSDISIDLIAKDFEKVREHLGVEKWMVWGGSYGSTVGINYALKYPTSCIALILRGIYLDTKQELREVYTRAAFEGSQNRMQQFDLLYTVADENARQAGRKKVDPNNPFQLLKEYERMIQKGDRNAIWNWHTFETNLMEEDPKQFLDPLDIIESKFPEAQSVAFFETRLWLHGTLEEPSQLLQRVDRLAGIPVWICQGRRDEVCPPENAQHLVEALEEIELPLTANFIESGHEDTDPVMEDCLKASMQEFLELYDE